VHAPQASLLPLAGALSLGYLAASMLCEGAKHDADNARRSAQLPFRYDTLVWWHAVLPCLLLGLAGSLPAAVLALAAGKAWLLALAAVCPLVLTGGALVNCYRGQFQAEALSTGFETPFGNSGGIVVVLWAITGPLLAVAPLVWLYYRAVSAPGTGPVAQAVVLSLALAGWLGSIAARRARRLRES